MKRFADTCFLLLLMTLTGSVGAAVSLAGTRPFPVTLKPEAANAFAKYVQITEARNAAEITAQDFLWADGLSGKDREDAFAALKRGDVVISRLESKDGNKEISFPGAMVHHWIGTIFVPGASLDEVLKVLQDYNHQSLYYAPDVEQSQIEAHEGDSYRVHLRFRRRMVVTVVMDTEHQIQYFRDSATTAHSRSSATRISEVEDPDEKDEHFDPPGHDDGYLWRMETWWRMVERDGGVYLQSEAVSLTRDIPTGLGWMVGPFVTSVPKVSLKFTLEATRKAVTEQEKAAK